MDMGEQKEDATQETSSKCDTEKKKTSHFPFYPGSSKRDPYFMVYLNPHITGQYNPLYIS